MAVLQRVLATKPSLASSGALFLYYYICDTDGEKPSSGIQVGDLCICLDGPKIYLGYDATTWRELTKAGSSGYAGTGMLGSGNANNTTYLRGDNTWSTPSGGSGSFSATEVEIDFSYPPQRCKSFVISDASITSGSKILVTQSGNAPTGKNADDNEMEALTFSAVPGTGQFTLFASGVEGWVGGAFKVLYTVG